MREGKGGSRWGGYLRNHRNVTGGPGSGSPTMHSHPNIIQGGRKTYGARQARNTRRGLKLTVLWRLSLLVIVGVVVSPFRCLCLDLGKIGPILRRLKVRFVVGEEFCDGGWVGEGQDTGSWSSHTGLHALESLCLQQLFYNRYRLWRDI